jgi:hypothetical protein
MVAVREAAIASIQGKKHRAGCASSRSFVLARRQRGTQLGDRAVQLIERAVGRAACKRDFRMST